MPRRGAIVVLLLFGCSKRNPAPPDDLLRDKEIVEKAARADLEMDKVRREALVAAKDAIVPRPDLGRCPIEWKPSLAPRGDDDGDAATNTAYWNVGRWDASEGKDLGVFPPHMDDVMVSIDQLGIAFADEVANKPGPRHFRIAADSDPLLFRGRPRSELARYVDPTYQATDQELVIDTETDARLVGDKAFEPGFLKGRFYVFDHVKRAIVCAAHVAVRSSSELEVMYRVQYEEYERKSDNQKESAAEHLRGDLRQQALLAASESLFIAGPIVREDAGAAKAGSRDAGKR